MRILIISVGYPSEQNKARLVFLQRLVNKFVDLGNECTVISPVRRFRSESRCSRKEIHTTELGKQVPVYFPQYWAGWIDKKFSFDPVREATVCGFVAAVERIIEENDVQFDCVYAHFTGLAAMCAARIAKKYGKPAFAAAGESRFTSLTGFNRPETVVALNQLNGIISVSSHNKRTLVDAGVLDDKRIVVLPNGADESKFFPRDKLDARKEFGIPNDAFVVAFVGHFIERKGPLRLTAAAEGTDVKLIFAGKGEQKPTGSNILYCDVVAPEKTPVFLSAADAFALPTQNEGCCNAIVEALCCGIPVVSSDRPFNYDVLDATCSLLIDPDDVGQLREAILTLKNNPDVYRRLQEGARQKGRNLSLEQRAVSILSWMTSRM